MQAATQRLLQRSKNAPKQGGDRLAPDLYCSVYFENIFSFFLEAPALNFNTVLFTAIPLRWDSHITSIDDNIDENERAQL